MKISVLCHDLTNDTITEVEPAEIPRVLSRDTAVFWVDMQDPQPEDLHWLYQALALPAAAQRIFGPEKQPIRVDRTERHVLFTVEAACLEKERGPEFSQIRVAVNRRFLLSVQYHPISNVEAVRTQWAHSRTTEESILYLLYLLLDTVVDSFSPPLDALGGEIDDLQERISSGPAEDVMAPITSVRGKLHDLHQRLGPMRDMSHAFLRMARGGQRIFPFEWTERYFADMEDHLRRTVTELDAYREQTTSVLEAHSSTQANQLNQIIRILTVATIVLSSAALVTSFYGMNAHGLLINSGLGYSADILLGIVVFVILVEYLYFRWKRWI